MIDEPSEEMLTLEEVAARCDVELDLVEDLVRHGVIEVTRGGARRVHATWVLRVRKVARLRRDLDVNVAGAAVILDLLERIEELEDELRQRGLR
jgi:hypothetical protein